MRNEVPEGTSSQLRAISHGRHGWKTRGRKAPMFDLKTEQDIYIVSMPWTWIVWPPLMQGQLQCVLNGSPLKAASLSAHLHHAELLIQAGLAKDWMDYNRWANNKLYPEWAFTNRRFRGPEPDVAAVLDQEVPGEDRTLLERIRVCSETFVARLAQEVVQSRARCVIFPLDKNFFQMTGSLAVAQAIRDRDPRVVTVLCGNLCDGVSGEAALQAFTWLDAVIHGDIEGVAVEVLQALLSGEPPATLPGTSFRRPDGEIVLGGGHRNTWDINRPVIPDYDEYFEKLDALDLGLDLREHVAIPLETSRGCWWGAKHHCTFCALFGQVVYSAKSVENVLAEVQTLAARYRHHRFNAMDYILRHQGCDELLDGLAGLDSDYRFFFESKSGLSLERMIKYREAGIHAIQVGVESFSTPILKAMDKGVTGIQNVRTLKFGAWLGIDIGWNLISGIPGERPEDYQYLAELIPSLIHLQPGHFTHLALVRHSPYFKDPDRYGVKVGKPRPIYSILYPATEGQMADLAQVFDHALASGAQPGTYTMEVEAAMARWQRAHPHASGSLTYVRLGDRINIHDRRPGLDPCVYRLDRLESRIYNLVLDIVDRDLILEDSVVRESGLTPGAVEAFLESLVDARLLMREGDLVLGLAIPECEPKGIIRSLHGDLAHV